MTLFKFILALLIAGCVASVSAAERITALVTITNSAGTLTNQQLTVNGNTRYWTNVVYIPSTQVLTNYTESSAKTNLFRQIGTYPFASVTLVDNETNSFKIIGASDLAMVVTPSTGWATVSYSTQTVTTLYGVRVPISGEPSSGQQNYIASELITGLNLKGTNALLQSSVVASNLVGLTNSQTISGQKIFTNKLARFDGILSNSPSISGNVVGLTNGIWTNGVLDRPILTNGVNYGSAFRSPGSGSSSEQFGTGAIATGGNSVAIGNAAEATGANSVSIGSGANASASSSTALGVSAVASASGALAIGNTAEATHSSSSAIGVNAATTSANQIRIGTASEYVSIPGGLIVEEGITNVIAIGTNYLPVNSDISFARYPITSLANGNNAAVPVGTNVFIEVSGPSASFTINGIAAANAQRDGKIIYIVNQTGQDMTIAHQSGTDPTAANRIITMTGADRATTGNGAATLIYSGAASRWLLISFDP